MSIGLGKTHNRWGKKKGKLIILTCMIWIEGEGAGAPESNERFQNIERGKQKKANRGFRGWGLVRRGPSEGLKQTYKKSNDSGQKMRRSKGGAAEKKERKGDVYKE